MIGSWINSPFMWFRWLAVKTASMFSRWRNIQMDSIYQHNCTTYSVLLIHSNTLWHLFCKYFDCTPSTVAPIIIPLDCNIPCSVPGCIWWMVMCKRQPSSTSTNASDVTFKNICISAYFPQNCCWLVTRTHYHFISLSIMQVAAVAALISIVYLHRISLLLPSHLLNVRIFTGLAPTKAVTFHSYY